MTFKRCLSTQIIQWGLSKSLAGGSGRGGWWEQASMRHLKQSGKDSQQGQKAVLFLTQPVEMFLLLFIAPYLSVFSTFYLQCWFAHPTRLPLERPWLVLWCVFTGWDLQAITGWLGISGTTSQAHLVKIWSKQLYRNWELVSSHA